MSGLADTSLAGDPSPKDKATDVHQDVVLSWTAGEFAASHDVPHETSEVDVNNASRARIRWACLSAKGRADTQYDPEGLLEFGQTYYWRIDEVNASPSNAIFKGELWASPRAYSSRSPPSQPRPPLPPRPRWVPRRPSMGSASMPKTSIPPTADMWTAVLPAWIQYEFDKVYKLDKLLVWNSNQIIEAFVRLRR